MDPRAFALPGLPTNPRSLDFILMPFRHVSMLFLALWVGGLFVANVPKLFHFNHVPKQLRRKIAETLHSGCGLWQPHERMDFVEYLQSTREAGPVQLHSPSLNGRH